MRYSLIIFIILLLTSKLSGQVHYTTRSTEDFSFPVFSSTRGEDILAIEKINHSLQLSELELIDGYEQKDIFERVSWQSDKNHGVYGGKTDISFSVLNNSNKVLSLMFNQASSGMTTHYWVKYYNFNPENGDMIWLEDIFTKEGYELFKQIAIEKRISAFREELIDFSLGEREKIEDDIPSCYRSDDMSDYYIQDNKIVIDGENCFSKNNKGYGITTKEEFSLNEFQDYLNDFGKCIFSLNKDNVGKYRSTQLPQLFEGTIGKMPILLCLRTSVNEVKAEYVYMKYGKGIYMEGSLSNKNLLLIEKDEKYDDVATLNAIFDTLTIKGTWADIKNNRCLEVNLNRK